MAVTVKFMLFLCVSCSDIYAYCSLIQVRDFSFNHLETKINMNLFKYLLRSNRTVNTLSHINEK
jgi:hypothetical protein